MSLRNGAIVDRRIIFNYHCNFLGREKFDANFIASDCRYRYNIAPEDFQSVNNGRGNYDGQRIAHFDYFLERLPVHISMIIVYIPPPPVSLCTIHSFQNRPTVQKGEKQGRVVLPLASRILYTGNQKRGQLQLYKRRVARSFTERFLLAASFESYVEKTGWRSMADKSYAPLPRSPSLFL